MPPVAEKNSRETLPVDDVERIIAERVAAEVARLDAERSARLDDLISQKLSNFNPANTSGFGDKSMMEALAEAIYAVSNEGQDVHRRRVPPEVMAKRVRAREEMEALIKKTIDEGAEQPVYKLTRACYLGEQMIQPYWTDRATRTTKATEVGWWGVPNEYMHPANEIAEKIHALYLESIDSHKKIAPGLRVTPGGLVVRSGGMNPDGGRDSAPRVGRDIHEPSLSGRNGDRPEVQTRILGTLMPPARQMV